jgi:hypothetical protein
MKFDYAVQEFIYIAFIFLILSSSGVKAEVSIRQTIILTQQEQKSLARLIRENQSARKLWLQLKKEAEAVMDDSPDPLSVIHYEGLLDTDPKRVRTERSLEDMDKVALLLFAYYASHDERYAQKAKEYILAWSKTYKATGNPINENKFEPLIHSYSVMRSIFNEREKRIVGGWLRGIADAEVANKSIPMNNWEAKRIKLVSLIGLILESKEYVEFADRHFKAYVEVALNGDGTTLDLMERDALGYHVSGLKPLMVYGITLEQFGPDTGFDPFTYQNSSGGSIEKSVEYVNPYALGEKVHKEWINTKVELDKKRAEAGLEKYQPGTHFKPEQSREMYELAYFYNDRYLKIINEIKPSEGGEYHSWFFLLLHQARGK